MRRPDKIITSIQNICGAPNLRENNKVLTHPVVVRTSFLGSMDKRLVFADVTFNLKDGKSRYGFFIMKYKKPLIAGAYFGPMISSSKEVEARAILFVPKEVKRKGPFEIVLLSYTKVVKCIK